MAGGREKNRERLRGKCEESKGNQGALCVMGLVMDKRLEMLENQWSMNFEEVHVKDIQSPVRSCLVPSSLVSRMADGGHQATAMGKKAR
jgi:hypothetical protein